MSKSMSAGWTIGQWCGFVCMPDSLYISSPESAVFLRNCLIVCTYLSANSSDFGKFGLEVVILKPWNPSVMQTEPSHSCWSLKGMLSATISRGTSQAANIDFWLGKTSPEHPSCPCWLWTREGQVSPSVVGWHISVAVGHNLWNDCSNTQPEHVMVSSLYVFTDTKVTPVVKTWGVAFFMT